MLNVAVLSNEPLQLESAGTVTTDFKTAGFKLVRKVDAKYDAQ